MYEFPSGWLAALPTLGGSRQVLVWLAFVIDAARIHGALAMSIWRRQVNHGTLRYAYGNPRLRALRRDTAGQT